MFIYSDMFKRGEYMIDEVFQTYWEHQTCPGSYRETPGGALWHRPAVT